MSITAIKLKIKSISICCLLSMFIISCTNNIDEPAKPNIVLFVADDIGWNDVGYHGSEIKTPTIDKLAETGVELDQFYVYPTCSPTRAALLTGKYASRFGIGGPIALKSKKVLPTNVETLPGLLSAKGYQTAITGKWHLGLRPESGPNHYGFDHAYGYLHGQVDQYTHLYKNGDTTWHRNGVFIEEEGHATDLITKEVKKYLTEIRDKSKPFFLYVPYSVPHYPVQEEDKWIESYKDLDDVYSRKIYAASAEHMDHSMEVIMNILENEEVLENTIIIFISDNGGQKSWDPETDSDIKLYDGKHGPYPKLGNNEPLKGYKTELYEGGIRVPAIIKWPGKLKKQKLNQLVKVTDLLPTLISIIDSTSLENISLDGNNVWDAISGTSELKKDRLLYLKTRDQIILRKGAWKLMHFGSSLDEGYEELYDIKNDPNETKNLIKENSQLRNELFNELKKQIKLDEIYN